MTRVYFWTVWALVAIALATPVDRDARAETPGDDPTATLTVVVTGFPSDQGYVRFALSNVRAGFPRHTPALRDADLPIVAGKTTWILRDLPYGEYTIRFYHDENENHQFDQGFLGIPKEGFGFSNNARPRWGPPSYKAARFQVQSPDPEMRLVVQ